MRVQSLAHQHMLAPSQPRGGHCARSRGRGSACRRSTPCSSRSRLSCPPWTCWSAANLPHMHKVMIRAVSGHAQTWEDAHRQGQQLPGPVAPACRLQPAKQVRDAVHRSWVRSARGPRLVMLALVLGSRSSDLPLGSGAGCQPGTGAACGRCQLRARFWGDLQAVPCRNECLCAATASPHPKCGLKTADLLLCADLRRRSPKQQEPRTLRLTSVSRRHDGCGVRCAMSLCSTAR